MNLRTFAGVTALFAAASVGSLEICDFLIFNPSPKKLIDVIDIINQYSREKLQKICECRESKGSRLTLLR